MSNKTRFQKHLAKQNIKKGQSNSKFNNEWTYIDGIKFDSKKEANYYKSLCSLLKAGAIKGFEHHPVYRIVINGVMVCKYEADFIVEHLDGKTEVIDVKSPITAKLQGFRLKMKLMKAVFGIDIKIV